MRDTTKGKNFGFRLPVEQFNVLKQIAESQDRSVASIIRLILDDNIDSFISTDHIRMREPAPRRI